MLLYEILHGAPPFDASSISDVVKNLKRGIAIKEHFSAETKDLLSKLLEFDYKKRMEIDLILQHPAFVQRLDQFRQPLTRLDKKIMRVNYLKNVDQNSHRNLPVEIQNYLEKKGQAKQIKRQVSHTQLRKKK